MACQISIALFHGRCDDYFSDMLLITKRLLNRDTPMRKVIEKGNCINLNVTMVQYTGDLDLFHDNWFQKIFLWWRLMELTLTRVNMIFADDLAMQGAKPWIYFVKATLLVPLDVETCYIICIWLILNMINRALIHWFPLMKWYNLFDTNNYQLVFPWKNHSKMTDNNSRCNLSMKIDQFQ